MTIWGQPFSSVLYPGNNFAGLIRFEWLVPIFGVLAFVRFFKRHRSPDFEMIRQVFIANFMVHFMMNFVMDFGKRVVLGGCVSLFWLKRCFLYMVIMALLFVAHPGLALSKEGVGIPAEHELTLKEAYQLGLKRAKVWNQEAQLVDMTSVDIEPKGSKGEHGKRSPWNLLFGVPGTNQALILSVSEGQITEVIQVNQTIHADKVIRPQEIVQDSTELIEKAKREFHLKPGVHWAEGYHFMLEKSEGIVFFAVVGLNPKHQFTKIYFDAQTGKALGMVVTH